MEEIVAEKDIVDKIGMTIPKGTKMFVETTLHNPITGKEELVVWIDNGTDDKELMPKTIVEKDKL